MTRYEDDDVKDRNDDIEFFHSAISDARRFLRERDEARAQVRHLAEYVRAAIESGCFSDGYAQQALEALAGLEAE